MLVTIIKKLCGRGGPKPASVRIKLLKLLERLESHFPPRIQKNPISPTSIIYFILIINKPFEPAVYT